MNKSSIQKKFRFVMIIAALALFITILTPVYIRYGKTTGYPKVVMMWTVLFGAGGGAKLNSLFDFSWVAFIGYSMALILLIISLVRKFITVEGSGKAGNVAADASCLICSLLALVMFILLPIVISKTSVNGAGQWLVKSYYGFGVSYILAIIICAVMFASSFIVLIAESIVKYKKIRDKKKGISENNNSEEK